MVYIFWLAEWVNFLMRIWLFVWTGLHASLFSVAYIFFVGPNRPLSVCTWLCSGAVASFLYMLKSMVDVLIFSLCVAW